MSTQRECPTCGDERLVIGTQGALAVARRCPTCRATCPLCEDVGFRYQVDPASGYEAVVPCSCTAVDRRIEQFNRATLPARYAEATLANFQPGRDKGLRNARHKASTFALEFVTGARGLLYHGPCGTGKTHLMVAILRHLAVKRGVGVRFIEFMHLLADLKARFGDPNRVGDPLADLVYVPVLAVDELGKGRGTDWELGVLDELISKRYNAGRTTLFTTNFSPSLTEGRDSLRERVGERIYSRLVEMCEFEPMQGRDYRKVKAREP
ncbi:MAG: ATP-binding protein [Myxococcales bacterium]|nr:ATP-binding protein [Myxococcales bacterium]